MFIQINISFQISCTEAFLSALPTILFCFILIPSHNCLDRFNYPTNISSLYYNTCFAID